MGRHEGLVPVVDYLEAGEGSSPKGPCLAPRSLAPWGERFLAEMGREAPEVAS